MPRDMFGDVNQPSIKIGNRKWYTVPVSLLSHAMIVLALVAIPILAPNLLPMPDKTIIFAGAIEPPTPPPPPVKRNLEEKPKPIETGPPMAPPDGIKPEVPTTIVDPGGPDVGFIAGPITTGPPEAPPKIDKPAPDLPIRVGGLIRPPVKLSGSQPVYPPIAQSARVQGVVIVEATIGTDGHVINAKVLRSIPLLDTAALDAVRTWSYSPTLLNGIPVAVIMTVTVQFSLN